MNLLVSILGDFVALFFPRQCCVCATHLVKGEDIVCTQCIIRLPRPGYPIDRQNPVLHKLAGRLPLAHALVFLEFRKGGSTQRILHQLKYANRPDIGLKVGEVYGLELAEQHGLAQAFDLIVPVPLHPSRLRKRGYNQSAKFAEGLARVLEATVDEVALKRNRATATQTRKSAVARWENVRDAFSVPNPHQLEGKSILLVDDVMTTGATLEACGAQLLRYGCRQLSVALIAEAQ